MVDVLKKVLIGGGAVVACVMCGSTFGMKKVVQNFSQVGSAKKAYNMDVKKSGELAVKCSVQLLVTKNSVFITVDKKREGSVVKDDKGVAVLTASDVIGEISSSVPGKVVVKLTRLNSPFHNGDYHALVLAYQGGSQLLTKSVTESGEIEISKDSKISLMAVLLKADKRAPVETNTKFEDYCESINETDVTQEKDLSCTYSVDVSMK